MIPDHESESGPVPGVIVLNDQGGGFMSISDKSATIRAQMKHHEPIICFQQNQMEEVRNMGTQDGALTAESGMHNTNYIVYPAAFMGGQGATARGIAYCSNGTTPTLKGTVNGSNMVPDIVYPSNLCYAIEGNTVDRDTGKNGRGWCENLSPTLNTQDRHAICYTVDGRNNCLNPEISGTLQAHNNGGWSINCTNPVVYEKE